MHLRQHPALSAVWLGLVALCACVSGSPSVAQTTSQDTASSCEGPIALPLSVFEGFPPSPPPAANALIVGTIDERVPFPFDWQKGAQYSATSGLTQQGWTFQATSGEVFDYDLILGNQAVHPAPRFYGPIGQCQAPLAQGAANTPRGTWTAPADGTYFVSMEYGLSFYPAGTTTVMFSDMAITADPGEGEATFYLRHRLADGKTPSGHSLVTAASWPSFFVQDAAFVALGPGAPLSVVAVGTTPYTTQTASLLVASTAALQTPLVLPACEPNVLGRFVTADFDGDGFTDILAGANLFRGQAGGGFVCTSIKDAVPYGNAIYGVADLDSDGTPDLVTGTVTVAGAIYVVPVYSRGGSFVAGTYRSGSIGFMKDALVDARSGLVDVDGDGVPEIVLGILGSTTQGGPETVRAFAFKLPAPDPADASPSLSSAIPLAAATIDPTLMPPIAELDRFGPRQFDADQDGWQDSLAAGSAGWTQEQLDLAYGMADGSQTLPVRFLYSNDSSSTQVFIDHADYDGDGCPDVLLGAWTLVVLRGVGCVTK